MQIAPHTVVSIDYTLTDDDGAVIDTSKGGPPLTYIHGIGQIVPGLEAALLGRSQGDAFRVRLEAVDAYGESDPERVHTAQRDQFGATTPEVGMQFRADGPEGDEILTVIEITDDVITLDGNHPLAGVPLTFDVAVVAVRIATAQEIQHGHAHGDEGEDH